MKWISFVEMENFKIHRQKRVEFGRYMNIMVGESDTGKSTILKAMIKCLFNKPDRKGESFLTWGSGRGSRAIVRVGVKDDQDGRYDIEDAPETIIERVLGKSGVNEYNLYFPDGTVSNYAGFGKTVPPEVMSVHGMREVDMGYGKEQLNYMGQFDGFFLVGRRPEEVATAIGRLARTEIVDRVKDGIRSDIASNTRVLGQVKKEIETEQAIIDSFQYLQELEGSIEILDETMEHLKERESFAKANTNLSATIKSSAARLQDASLTLKDSVDFSAVAELLEVAETQCQQSSSLHRKVVEHSDDLSGQLYEVDEIIRSTPDIELVEEHLSEASTLLPLSEKMSTLDRSIKRKCGALTDASDALKRVPDFNAAHEMIEDLSGKALSVEAATALSAKIKRMAQTVVEQCLKVNTSKEDLGKAKQALSEAMKGRCPLCGSEVSEDRLDEITLHLSEEGA